MLRRHEIENDVSRLGIAAQNVRADTYGTAQPALGRIQPASTTIESGDIVQTGTEIALRQQVERFPLGSFLIHGERQFGILQRLGNPTELRERLADGVQRCREIAGGLLDIVLYQGSRLLQHERTSEIREGRSGIPARSFQFPELSICGTQIAFFQHAGASSGGESFEICCRFSVISTRLREFLLCEINVADALKVGRYI